MKRAFIPMLAALLLAAAPMAHSATVNKAKAKATVAAPVVVEEKVVYHVNDSANATAALRNIKNHLSAAPDAKIAVVTHAKGIDFLLAGAADKDGNPYEPNVQELKAKGVDFRVCNNTLVSRKLDASAVIPEATIVPSGVAEIGKLQAKEGYVYLKP